MKKSLCLSFFLTFSNPLQALVIELLEEIKTSPHKGTFKAKVLDSKEPKQVLGIYNISPHKKTHAHYHPHIHCNRLSTP
ncbi:hypothetical protein ckin129_13000 [Helicobacter pylori]